MTFLQRVNQRVANPNLFILFNRWDAADDADDIDKVKAQHLERARELLVDELDASTNEDDAWKKLVYFVSAREAFAIRSGKLSADKQVGVQERYNSFESFEKAFEEKVSQSAIRTKFDNNLNRGHEILDVVMAASSELNERLESQSKARSDQITAMLDSIMKVERMQSRLTSTCKDLLEKLEQDLEAECDSALASWLFFDFPDFVEKFDYANFHKADDPDKTMYTRRLAEMSVDNLLDTLTSSRSKGFVLHLVETLESIGETTKNNLQSDIYAMVEGHVGLALHDVSGKNGVNTIVVNGVGKTKFTRRSTISGSNSRRPQSSPLPTSHLKNVAEASNESMNASGDNECTVNDKGVQIQDADNDGVSANGDTYKEQISKSTSAALPITSRSQAHHGMLSLPSQIIRSQFNQLGSDFAPDLNFHFSLVNGGARTSQDNIDSLQRTPSLISNRAVRGKRDEGSRAAVASTGIYVAVPTTVAGIMYRREGTDGLMKSGAVILGFAGVLAALEYSSFNSGMKEQRLKEQWIDYVMGYLQAKRDAIVEPIVSHFVDQAKMYISTITLLLNEQVVQMRGRLEKIMHTNDDIKEIVEQSAHVISRCEQLKIRMVDLASDIAMQE
ncbi:hypothetical protein SARC_12513 [Sphaeroforma arctica JP610]|uniref:Fzo/mitofusin HR2 domain-containing protein n=1 Tax=Sphaeroforma arctica JP610 TaxID=667725 RepID=A0A0L0FDW7_9EUKA|nr:hypothetical protein SARC_12513 [Sphaeroforma arctica JP610]KNC74950.1 hypothetical protein SARC_12513 [Sphaeroforma arctica JP610]|eukprot:XP_014148852.1 hypothetical protein SARC_12513 [Sphaeroforma arctica JP610]